MTDKMPMQADGKGSTPIQTDTTEPKWDGAGDGNGGAYPNPHTGHGEPDDGFLGHGGQSDIGHYGGGQLDDEVVDKDADANASTH